MIIIFGYSNLSTKVAYLLKEKNYRFCIVEPNKKEYEFAKKDALCEDIYNFNFYDDEELISNCYKEESIRAIFCFIMSS